MGLPAGYIKYIIKCHKKYKLKGPVLSVSNLDIYATKEDIVEWIKSEGLKITNPKTIKFSTSLNITKINPLANKFIHAKTFFEFLNIKENQYYDIDKFDFDKPKILHDLEKPLPTKYHNFFNLVLDSGTIEHIFDVKSVMENMARAVRVNGLIIHFNPAQNFLNHGFYQFSPTFFHDFYTSNGFKVVESYIIEICGNKYRYHFYDQKKDYTGLFLNPKDRLVNCFIVRKTKNLKQMVSPTQYYYKMMSEDQNKMEKDFNNILFDKIVKSVRSKIPFRYHGIFFGIWTTIKRLTAHRRYFDIS